jgi:hypothetical protein
MSMETRKHYTTLLIPLFALILFPGCASYQVRIPDSDPLEQQYQGRLVHAFAWGLYLKPQVLPAECQGEAINDVRIERNYLYDLASVLTLGIWMPIEVKFRCHAPGIDAGPFPSP